MTYRVVQWATGAMGRACLRGVLDRPGYELVGVFAYDDAKIGRDTGELIRRPPIGVAVSGTIEEIESIDADVVIHAARIGASYDEHDDDIVRLLRSGKNVISINGNTFPPHWTVERRERIDQACAEGRSSFMGAGLNPGFAAEQLAIVASAVCLDVNRVSIAEVAMCNEMRSADYVFGLLGFGAQPGANDMNADDWAPARTLNAMFEEVVASLAGRLGFHLTRIVRSHRGLTTAHRLDVAAGTISPGTVSHLDWCWRGVIDDDSVVELRIAWAMDRTHVDPAHTDTWRIRIDGTPGVDLGFGLTLPDHLAGRTSVEPLGVAGSVLNAIPHVVAARPGAIATTPPMSWAAAD